MPRGRKLSPEQIVVTLRQIEVQLAQGMKLAQACKEAGISEQSYYRWRKEYGGVAVEQAKRLKDLERENARLRRLVADLSLEKQVLKDVASGNLQALSGAAGRWLASKRSMASRSVTPAASSASRGGHSVTSPPSALTRTRSPGPS
jgi:transposase-like protein